MTLCCSPGLFSRKLPFALLAVSPFSPVAPPHCIGVSTSPPPLDTQCTTPPIYAHHPYHPPYIPSLPLRLVTAPRHTWCDHAPAILSTHNADAAFPHGGDEITYQAVAASIEMLSCSHPSRRRFEATVDTLNMPRSDIRGSKRLDSRSPEGGTGEALRAAPRIELHSGHGGILAVDAFAEWCARATAHRAVSVRRRHRTLRGPNRVRRRKADDSEEGRRGRGARSAPCFPSGIWDKLCLRAAQKRACSENSSALAGGHLWAGGRARGAVEVVLGRGRKAAQREREVYATAHVRQTLIGVEDDGPKQAPPTPTASIHSVVSGRRAAEDVRDDGADENGQEWGCACLKRVACRWSARGDMPTWARDWPAVDVASLHGSALASRPTLRGGRAFGSRESAESSGLDGECENELGGGDRDRPVRRDSERWSAFCESARRSRVSAGAENNLARRCGGLAESPPEPRGVQKRRGQQESATARRRQTLSGQQSAADAHPPARQHEGAVSPCENHGWVVGAEDETKARYGERDWASSRGMVAVWRQGIVEVEEKPRQTGWKGRDGDRGKGDEEGLSESWIRVALGLREDLSKMIPRDEVEEIGRVVMRELDALEPGCVSTIVGGYRRGKPESNDVDIVFTHPDAGKVKGLCKRFVKHLHGRGMVTHVMHLSSFHAHDPLRTAHWDTLEKSLTVFVLPGPRAGASGVRRRVDLIFAPPEVYWTAVVGWSGSIMFQRDLRQWAKDRCGMKFDSSGITRRYDSKEFHPKTEKEAFELLGLEWVDPVWRNADLPSVSRRAHTQKFACAALNGLAAPQRPRITRPGRAPSSARAAKERSGLGAEGAHPASRASSCSLLGASESAPSGLGCGAHPGQLSLFRTSRANGEALASVLTTAVAVHKGAHVARAAPRSAQHDAG
ncbi:hypothetical protein VTO73DRAFT_2101 [Trametes versicolor]